MGFKNNKNGRSLKADIIAQSFAFKNLVSKKFPEKIMSEAGKLVASTFANQQYPGKNKWKGRKKPDSGRAIMVKTGDLKRDELHIEREGNLIIIGSDLPYAQIHNEGLTGNAFGKHKFQMPERQTIPIPGDAPPPEMQRNIDKFIDDEMDKLFNN